MNYRVKRLVAGLRRLNGYGRPLTKAEIDAVVSATAKNLKGPLPGVSKPRRRLRGRQGIAFRERQRRPVLHAIALDRRESPIMNLLMKRKR